MHLEDDPGCCAINHIIDLADHQTAIGAMREFCATVSIPTYEAGKIIRGGSIRLTAFYIFTGVQKKPCDKVKFGYGGRFASFIRKHKLGIVSQSVLRSNVLHHPDHIDRVWVWAPHKENLLKWWKENR